MRVYLSGPMRGIEEWNFPAFDMASERWQRAGHQVFSPAAMARALGYGPGDGHSVDPTSVEGAAHLKHVMSGDIAALYASDAIALLPGWEKSTGATVELSLAQFLGLRVYDALTLERMDPPSRPWQYTPPMGRVDCIHCEGKGTLLGCAGDRSNPECWYCAGKGTVFTTVAVHFDTSVDATALGDRFHSWENREHHCSRCTRIFSPGDTRITVAKPEGRILVCPPCYVEHSRKG